MRELSLHILDIVQNSISAGASRVDLIIEEDVGKDLFNIRVIDDGRGIEEKELERVIDPFVTSRETREVGLGLPFFKASAEHCGGVFKINSSPGKGTEVIASFKHSHIDRAPLGDIVSTLVGLIATNPELDFVYQHSVNKNIFLFDTREVKKELDGIRIDDNRVLKWIDRYLRSNIKELYGGEELDEVTGRIKGIKKKGPERSGDEK